MLKPLLFVALIILACCGGEAKSQIDERIWRVGEQQYQGRLQELKDGIVEIKTKDRKEQTFRVSELSEFDQQYLAKSIYEIVELDQKQFKDVMGLMEGFFENPADIFEELKRLEGRPVRSPYASMVLGVTRAAMDGDHNKAIKNFNNAISATKTSRKFLGEGYNRIVLQSLLNNAGVCKLKQMKGDSAAKSFMAAVDEGGMSFPVHHNADVLLNRASVKLGVNLKSGAKRNLKKLLELEREDPPGIRIPGNSAYFLYTLQWNAPLDASGVKEVFVNNDLKPLADGGQHDGAAGFELLDLSEIEGLTALQRNLIFPDPRCTACRGKGRYECDVKNCDHGTLIKKVRVVTGRAANGRPIIADVQRKDGKCRNCGKDGKVKCPHCKGAGMLPPLR